MKPETRLSMLEAFAKSKGPEFAGFQEHWLKTHPEPLEPIIIVEEPSKRSKRKAKAKPVEVVEEEATEEDAGA